MYKWVHKCINYEIQFKMKKTYTNTACELQAPSGTDVQEENRRKETDHQTKYSLPYKTSAFLQQCEETIVTWEIHLYKKWKLLNQLPVDGYLACELFSCIFTSSWRQKSLTLSLIFCRENYNFCILKAIISCIDYLNSIQYIWSDKSTLNLKTYVTIFSKILKSSTPCSNRTFMFLANSIKMNMKLL